MLATIWEGAHSGASLVVTVPELPLREVGNDAREQALFQRLPHPLDPKLAGVWSTSFGAWNVAYGYLSEAGHGKCICSRWSVTRCPY